MVFEVVASPAEEIHDDAMEPWRLCEENALLKARAVASDHPDKAVIGADTLVFSEGRALGKPRDMEEAREMLLALSGKIHRVCTGVCILLPDGGKDVFHDVTEVVFHDFGDEVITGYFARVNPLDKAGAYGIQEHGEMLVSEIRGSFENVMGLPVAMVVDRLLSASPDLRTAEG